MSQKFIKHLIANNLILLLSIGCYNVFSLWCPITKISFSIQILIILSVNLTIIIKYSKSN